MNVPQYQGTLSTEQSEESWYIGESRGKGGSSRSLSRFSSKLVNLAETLILFGMMYDLLELITDRFPPTMKALYMHCLGFLGILIVIAIS